MRILPRRPRISMSCTYAHVLTVSDGRFTAAGVWGRGRHQALAAKWLFLHPMRLAHDTHARAPPHTITTHVSNVAVASSNVRTRQDGAHRPSTKMTSHIRPKLAPPERTGSAPTPHGIGLAYGTYKPGGKPDFSRMASGQTGHVESLAWRVSGSLGPAAAG